MTTTTPAAADTGTSTGPTGVASAATAAATGADTEPGPAGVASAATAATTGTGTGPSRAGVDPTANDADTGPTGGDHSATDTGVHRLRATRLASQIQFLTARARSRGNGHANALLKTELGLKVSHFSVLSVAARGTNPTQRELSEFLDLDPSQVVSLVDVLEKRGLVERLTDPKDRRSRMIAVTEEGHRIEQLGYELTEASDREVLTNLSPAEREQLRELLTRIAF